MKKIILIALSGFVIPIAAGTEHRNPAPQAQLAVAKKRNYRPYIIGGAITALAIGAFLLTRDVTITGNRYISNSTFLGNLTVKGPGVTLDNCHLMRNLIVECPNTATVTLTGGTSIRGWVKFTGASGVVQGGGAEGFLIVRNGIVHRHQ
jgi:hypothetical protein